MSEPILATISVLLVHDGVGDAPFGYTRHHLSLSGGLPLVWRLRLLSLRREVPGSAIFAEVLRKVNWTTCAGSPAPPRGVRKTGPDGAHAPPPIYA